MITATQHIIGILGKVRPGAQAPGIITVTGFLTVARGERASRSRPGREGSLPLHLVVSPIFPPTSSVLTCYAQGCNLLA